MFRSDFPSNTPPKATSPASHPIFCCASAGPVIADSTNKAHNDPNQKYHDLIIRSFMAYVARTERQTVLTSLIEHHLHTTQRRDAIAEEVAAIFSPPDSQIRFSQDHSVITAEGLIPMSLETALSALTPPFTPALSASDVVSSEGNGKEMPAPFWDGDPTLAELASTPFHPTQPTPALEESIFGITDPDLSTDLETHMAAFHLPDSFMEDTTELESILPGAALPILNTSELTPPTSVTSAHDHKMIIPTMPHPLFPTEELLYNPLTPETQYVVHLTSRHDYGPVYSHRYFACPADLNDDWVEISLLQWFAQGEPFKMKAERWDIKCERDNRFFRMTLRPNLDLRVTQ